MGMIKVLVWSTLCIGLGIFLGTHRFDGRTAVEQAEQSLKKPAMSFKASDVEDVIDAAKKKLGGKEVPTPTEKHTLEDKDAVNRLIARRKP